MTLQKVLDLSEYEKWREMQRQARKDGRLIGIGLVESTLRSAASTPTVRRLPR